MRKRSAGDRQRTGGGRGGRRPARRGAATERRLERADWELAALAAIGERGLAGVAVEPLAAALGVTKGSFYWHFADREALVDAALLRWEADDTDGVMARMAKLEDPGERLRAVLREGFLGHIGGAVDAALVSEAQHPRVAPVLARVAARRLAFTDRAYRALGLSAAEARRRSLLAYAAYLGHFVLARTAGGVLPRGRAAAAYVALVTQALVPARAPAVSAPGRRRRAPRPRSPGASPAPARRR